MKNAKQKYRLTARYYDLQSCVLFILLLLVTLTACHPRQEQKIEANIAEQKTEASIAEGKASWNLYHNDTLTIKGHFTDCGEWGGHHETLQFYRLDDNTVHGYLYLRDSVTCDDIPEFRRYIVERREGTMSAEKRNDVEVYLSTALRKSFRPTMISHAENYYTVLRKGYAYEQTRIPEMKFSYCPGNKEICNDFEELLSRLFAEE